MKKEVAKKILKGLGLAVMIGGAIVFPNLVTLFDWIERNSGRAGKLVSRRSFYGLKSRRLVAVKKQKHKVKLILTEKGKQLIKRYSLADLSLSKSQPWDSYWRLIMFDIPEVKRVQRDLLRLKLRKLGFLQIQKSVFIQPYPCVEAIKAIRNYYDLRPGELYLFESKVLEGESVLKKHFNLK